MALTQQQIIEAKSMLLEGKSFYATAKALGVNPINVSRSLQRDPDIVALRESGGVRPVRGNKVKDYTTLPYVIDVLENGMTTVAAAKKHGISQPVVWQKVKKAREMLEARAEAEPTPTPTNPVNDFDLDLLVDIVKSHAQRLQMTPEALLDRVKSRLA